MGTQGGTPVPCSHHLDRALLGCQTREIVPISWLILSDFQIFRLVQHSRCLSMEMQCGSTGPNSSWPEFSAQIRSIIMSGSCNGGCWTHLDRMGLQRSLKVITMWSPSGRNWSLRRFDRTAQVLNTSGIHPRCRRATGCWCVSRGTGRPRGRSILSSQPKSYVCLNETVTSCLNTQLSKYLCITTQKANISILIRYYPNPHQLHKQIHFLSWALIE